VKTALIFLSFFIVGCVTLPPTQPNAALSSVVPSPQVPYAVLAVDHNLIRKGDSVILTLTLVNPTSHSIPLPDSQPDAHGFDTVAGCLSAKTALEGVPEGHFTRSDMLVFTTSLHRPATRPPLAPRSSRNYRILWRSPFEDRGRIDLSFTVEFAGEKTARLRAFVP
jgi:hypothetical protein